MSVPPGQGTGRSANPHPSPVDLGVHPRMYAGAGRALAGSDPGRMWQRLEADDSRTGSAHRDGMTSLMGNPTSTQSTNQLVAARAVDAVKVYGRGAAEVRALDGVSVDFEA